MQAKSVASVPAFGELLSHSLADGPATFHLHVLVLRSTTAHAAARPPLQPIAWRRLPV